MTAEGERLRRGAGSLTQRELARYAESLGWTRASSRRGKGSHLMYERAGALRPVTIPAKTNRRTALAIIGQLEGRGA